MKKIYGVYKSYGQAMEEVRDLLWKKYSREQIKVVSKRGVTSADYTTTPYKDLNQEEIKILEPYKENLDAGYTIILIEPDLTGDGSTNNSVN